MPPAAVTSTGTSRTPAPGVRVSHPSAARRAASSASAAAMRSRVVVMSRTTSAPVMPFVSMGSSRWTSTSVGRIQGLPFGMP